MPESMQCNALMLMPKVEAEPQRRAMKTTFNQSWIPSEISEK
jgi:hypothetical protein